jgi:hypothetical protein
MPIRINSLSVIDQFSEVIPRAKEYGEAYLRTLASSIQEYEPPVTMRLDMLTSGTFRAEQQRCLVVEPTSPRLRHYRTAHVATPSGGSLTVGWYLLGGERADGRQIGIFNVGAASELDVQEIMSIVGLIQDYAVVPAIHRIAQLSQQGSLPAGGFMGV